MSENESRNTEIATFGAGCFWQVEMAYKETEGVVETAVGYEGGHVDNPTYEQVCTRHDRARRGHPGHLRPRGRLLRGAG